jgi:hypothetical protein
VVVAEARRDYYRIGRTAVIDIWATDAITGMPAGDVDAGALVQQGKRDKVVVGLTKTDAEGHAVVRLRLKRSVVEPGWARTTAAAWQSYNTPVYCGISRSGYRTYRRLFFIRS